ncbi:replication initiator [Pseudonocardia alni]|uniref:replication initiator n=2 Tax=Pseudonocardia alni TaxID=33907 RepID=UPI0036C51B26
MTTATTPRPPGFTTTRTALLRRAGSRDHRRWLDHTAATRGCVRPVRLTGELHDVDTTTGAITRTRHTHELPDGVIYVPCGDRRASVCPPCAETYRADTYQLIRSGLVGGKGVPHTVAGHPAVFATLTAPSFGPVHTRVVNPRTGQVRPCRPRRNATPCPHGRLLTCTQRHTESAACLGRPLCLDCYDHAHHVVWNGWAGELWRRTMIALNRALRPLTKLHGTKLRVSYGKVAEYQRRGVVHFHALIRLDTVDPDDPDAILPPPDTITPARLAELVAGATRATGFDTPPYADTGHTWPITWGPQTDIRAVTHGLDSGAITSDAVAAYLAKYATKATEPAGLPITGRLTADLVEHYADAHTHLGRLIAYARQLGTRPADWTSDDDRAAWHDTYGRLERWTHMLGFGGHFATKSRRYSTTHTRLRAERRTWRRTSRTDHWRRHHGDDDQDLDDTTLVVCRLTLAGIGWNSTADAQLAADAAARAREHRALAREERTTSKENP